MRLTQSLVFASAAPTPVVLNTNVHHFEVVIAMNPRDGTVVTLDPATGDRMKRSRRVLDLEWKHAGYATLVVVATTPPEENCHGQLD